MSNRPATVRPLKDRIAYRTSRCYLLVCEPCGWDGGTVIGTAEAARALRAHPCPPRPAGPYAVPVGWSR